MQIVLPGALPDANAAQALFPHIPQAAPTFAQWLQQGRAHFQAAPWAEAGCTPYEQWLLRSRHFTAEEGQNLSAGLGPLWTDESAAPGEAVWLAELVHVSPARDGAALIPAGDLQIAPTQAERLLDSAQALFEGSGFSASSGGALRWRLRVPPGYSPRCASPALVSITSVNEWWPQDLEARPWRRLVNELQMLWFDHPVNREREAEGLLPINSLWLFGGARPEQFKPAAPMTDTVTHTDLLSPEIAQDWTAWLDALSRLEEAVFKPLAATRPSPALVLMGRNEIIEVQPGRTGLLKRLLPQKEHAWRTWWLSRN